jgi:hypothetical protein
MESCIIITDYYVFYSGIIGIETDLQWHFYPHLFFPGRTSVRFSNENLQKHGFRKEFEKVKNNTSVSAP